MRLAVIGVFIAICAARLSAGTPPAGFSDSLVAGGLASPTAMALSPDGRIFVCEQAGALRVIKDGALLPTPFVTLTVDSIGERGLLGVAVHPNFPATPYVYVYYTRPGTVLRNVISRLSAAGDVAQPGSELTLLELDPLSDAINHNGGALHFGLDGKLYAAVGENAEPSNSQLLTNLLGKILRLNADGTVPVDNPFPGLSGNNRLIWAYGLRNPFTFAVQPGSGRIFINEVGQSSFEEINEGRAGANYGWPTTEGPTTNPAFDSPVYAYQQFGAEPTGCAIAGGAFYNPAAQQFPASYAGKYFFADLCGGWIYTLDPGPRTVTLFLTGAVAPVDVRVGPEGSLYYLQRGNGNTTGEVRRVDSTTAAVTISSHPVSRSVGVGGSATFNVTASGSNLSYQWLRNGSPISGATQSSYTVSNLALSDSGAGFRVLVTGTGGSALSNTATLTVTQGQAPQMTISAPAPGAMFSAGETVTYAGSGTDPDSGALSPQSLTWYVNYITGVNSPSGPVTRPFVGPVTGAGGTFTVPTRTPYTLPDVRYRISLTGRDPQGTETTVTRDISPRVSTLTLATAPAGLQLTLDGQPFTGSINSVVGLQRDLGAVSPQGGAATRQVFASWSDGGPQNHTIQVPLANSTYTASFVTQHRLTVNISPAGAGSVASAPVSGEGFFNAGAGVSLTAVPNAGWRFTGFSGDVTSSGNPSSVTMNGPKSVTANFSGNPVPVVVGPLMFVPVTPCRLLDTRPGQGTSGAFGPPSLAGGAVRTVPPAGRCDIPSGAAAYSFNVTVAPRGVLGYLTMWPAGQAQPFVSTLNSLDGRIVANAAVIQAGTGGAVEVFVTDAADLILDVNGFFVRP